MPGSYPAPIIFVPSGLMGPAWVRITDRLKWKLVMTLECLCCPEGPSYFVNAAIIAACGLIQPLVRPYNKTLPHRGSVAVLFMGSGLILRKEGASCVTQDLCGLDQTTYFSVSISSSVKRGLIYVVQSVASIKGG